MKQVYSRIESTVGISTIANQSNPLQINPQECLFCSQKDEGKLDSNNQFNQILKNVQIALSIKYSASQNSFYTKHVNEIVQKTRTSRFILYQFWNSWDSSEENLRRIYLKEELTQKLFLLGGYYRFHRDIPRIFQYSITKTLNKYHDKQRRLEYIRVTLLMKKQNMLQQQQKIAFVPDVPVIIPVIHDRVLGDEFNNPSYCTIFKNDIILNDSSINSLVEIKEHLNLIIQQQDDSYTICQQQEQNNRVEDYFMAKINNIPEVVQQGELIKIFQKFIIKNETRKIDKPKSNFCFTKAPIAQEVNDRLQTQNFQTQISHVEYKKDTLILQSMKQNVQYDQIKNIIQNKFQQNKLKQLIDIQKQTDYKQIKIFNEYTQKDMTLKKVNQVQQGEQNKPSKLLNTKRSNQSISSSKHIISNCKVQSRSQQPLLRQQQQNNLNKLIQKTYLQGYQSQTSSIFSKSEGKIKNLQPSTERKNTQHDQPREKSQSYDVFKKLPISNNRRLLKPELLQHKNLISHRKSSSKVEGNQSRNRQMMSCYESAQPISQVQQNLYSIAQNHRGNIRIQKQSELKKIMTKQIQQFINTQNSSEHKIQ